MNLWLVLVSGLFGIGGWVTATVISFRASRKFEYLSREFLRLEEETNRIIGVLDDLLKAK